MSASSIDLAIAIVILSVGSSVVFHPIRSAISILAAIIRSTVFSSSPARYPVGDIFFLILVPFFTLSSGKASNLSFFTLPFAGCFSASSTTSLSWPLKNPACLAFLRKVVFVRLSASASLAALASIPSLAISPALYPPLYLRTPNPVLSKPEGTAAEKNPNAAPNSTSLGSSISSLVFCWAPPCIAPAVPSIATGAIEPFSAADNALLIPNFTACCPAIAPALPAPPVSSPK